MLDILPPAPVPLARPNKPGVDVTPPPAASHDPARGAMENPATSATCPDRSREYKRLWSWSPSRSLLASMRAYQRAALIKDPVVAYFARKTAALRHRFWCVVCGADIPVNVRLGEGLLMPHPNGIVVHADAEVGPNCLIFQQVTIGLRHSGVPRIGGHVEIGACAKILGAVRIGDHARIGANAVVLQDVPAGAVAVGVPARIINS